MENKPLSDFGKAIKISLTKANRTQNWLIETLKARLPNNYIDGSLLYKILIGEVTGGKVVDEIKKILLIGSEQ